MKTLEQKVMTNVAVIYMARKFFGFTALKFYALVVSLVGIATLVSVSNVTANLTNVAQNGAESVVAFLVAAVLGTTLMVQVVLVLGIAAALSLLADAIRSISSSSSSRHQAA
jgi:hypothetical protein